MFKGSMVQGFSKINPNDDIIGNVVWNRKINYISLSCPHRVSRRRRRLCGFGARFKVQKFNSSRVQGFGIQNLLGFFNLTGFAVCEKRFQRFKN